MPNRRILLFAEENTVGTVEILDHAALFVGDELRVVTADEFAFYEDLVVRRAADNDPAGRKREFIDHFAVSPYFNSRDVTIVRCNALNILQLVVDAGVAFVLFPVQFVNCCHDLIEANSVFFVGKGAQ